MMRATNILTCSILPRDGSRSLAIRGTFTFASLSILWPGTLLETAAPTVCYGTRGSGCLNECTYDRCIGIYENEDAANRMTYAIQPPGCAYSERATLVLRTGTDREPRHLFSISS